MTNSFGEWLRQRRESLRLTQRELAASVYCSVSMIKKIETDQRRPSLELAALLASALQVAEPAQTLFVEVARGERPVDLLAGAPLDVEKSASELPFHAPVPLPSPATPFVGREQELADIAGRLADPQCRLLTLVGPGGAGKTRLAMAVAQRQQALLSDGVVFVPLVAILDSALLPDAVARSLRLILNRPAAQQVIAALRRRQTLLVLDNGEQLQGDLAWLSELLFRAPDVKVLVTSRERLQVAEEWAYVVPGLAEAVELFGETARRLNQDFDLEAQRTEVEQICRLVENLPLAVELAAGWTTAMPCEQIATQLRRDTAILATDLRNVPERHRSLQALFDHSWHLLLPTQQKVLRRLSVFRGGWQAEEAAAVAGASLHLLRQLVHKSLVRAGLDGRYEMHGLIRSYAAGKLDEAGEASDTRQRHFETYLALAAEFDARQSGPDSMGALTGFDREQDNFHTALGWGLDHEPAESIVRFTRHLGYFWLRRGAWRQGADWTRRAIKLAAGKDSPLLAIVLSTAAIFAYVQGRFVEAQSLALRAITMARRIDDAEALAAAYGTYSLASDNAEQALGNLRAGIELYEESGQHPHLLAGHYTIAGSWLDSSGRYAEARDYYEKSIVLHKQTGAVDRLAEPLARLGQLELRQGRLQQAYELTLQSIAALRATGGYELQDGVSETLLGAIELAMGKFDEAERTLREALARFDDRQHLLMKQETLALLGELMLARGNLSEAAKQFEESLAICRLLFDRLHDTRKIQGGTEALPIDVVALCRRVAQLAAAQGDDARAVTLFSTSDALKPHGGQTMPPALQERVSRSMATLQERMEKRAFDRAWQQGQGMSVPEAMAFVLD